MLNRVRGLGLVCVVFGLVGCGAGGSFIPAAGAPERPARSPDSVKVQVDADDDQIELGRIKAASGVHPPTTSGIEGGQHGVREQLKKIAAEHGCEAIVLLDSPVEDLYATSNGTPLYKTYQNASCFAKR
jgi:hypothetical protein